MVFCSPSSVQGSRGGGRRPLRRRATRRGQHCAARGWRGARLRGKEDEVTMEDLHEVAASRHALLRCGMLDSRTCACTI